MFRFLPLKFRQSLPECDRGLVYIQAIGLNVTGSRIGIGSLVNGVAEQNSKERDQEKRKESINNENLTGTIENRENRVGKIEKDSCGIRRRDVLYPKEL